MKIKIYQINSDRDVNNMLFMAYDRLEKYQGSSNVDSKIYDLMYKKEVPCNDLEDVFVMFNTNRPDDFKGHKLSASDIVEVIDSDKIEKGFYFCDSVGFKKVAFRPELCQISERMNSNPDIVELPYNEMKALFCQTEKEGGHTKGYIVFTPDSFERAYSEEARTYIVSSDNKAFIGEMGGYSIYASSLDGSDSCVRLELYMAAERGGKNGWKIERCYMNKADFDKLTTVKNPEISDSSSFFVKVLNEYDEYKVECLSLTPTEVFDLSYKTSIYNELLNLFDCDIDEDALSDKLKTIDRPLAFIYGEWLESENLSSIREDLRKIIFSI